jgi:phosphotriesterase-related protein
MDSGGSTVNRTELAGSVQTVLGLISPEELGVTLPHEHLIDDGSCYFVEPDCASDRAMAHKPVSLDILWWLRYHFTQNTDEVMLRDEQVAIEEAMRFKLAGGNTIVEVTSAGLGRDPAALARISRATGLNVLMGSGYYLAVSHSPEMDAVSEDEIVENIVLDIMEGVGTTGIRSGLIGEIGCSWPLFPNERKSLRAAGRAQKLTGAALHVHPGRNQRAPVEIVDILEDVGADLSRTIFDHVERTYRDLHQTIELAETGCCIEYDLFGREGYYPINLDLPNDSQRINELMRLIDEGYLDQLLISHDIWTKTQCCTYGGWGYAHILNNVVPVMIAKGMTRKQIRTIMVDNPRRMFAFA